MQPSVDDLFRAAHDFHRAGKLLDAERLYRIILSRDPSHASALNYLGVIAMETVWAIAATVPGPVVVDSWWFRPRDLEHARAGLAKAGAQVTIEVWCDVPVGVARERYAQRHRHAIHHDTRDMTDEWARWTADGQPLALGPVLRVDTTAPVDTPRLAKAVVEQLGAVTPTP